MKTNTENGMAVFIVLWNVGVLVSDDKIIKFIWTQVSAFPIGQEYYSVILSSLVHVIGRNGAHCI